MISTIDNDLRASILSTPDCPNPGITFRDITTLLDDARDPALIKKLDAVAGRVLGTG